jgi:hypothetical protein
MNSSGPRRIEQAVVALVVITACLTMIAPILPHLLPSIIVVGVIVIAVRLVFFHTRRW